MSGYVEMMKALGDENRFRIFMVLQQKTMCVCELLELLDIAGSTLSAHLKILKAAGLIEQKRDGRWIEYYSDKSNPLVVELYEFFNKGKGSTVEEAFMKADKITAEHISRDVCSSKVLEKL